VPFCQNLTREKLVLYKKHARKTLMKLTTGERNRKCCQNFSTETSADDGLVKLEDELDEVDAV